MRGTPVICTIHQPSAMLFQMFDHLLLLAPGGRTVYLGETGLQSWNAINYFNSLGASVTSNQNPAESIIEAMTAMYQLASSTVDSSKLGRALEAAYALPLCSQIVELTYRHRTAVWRSCSYNFSRLAKCIVCELFNAFTYFMADTSLLECRTGCSHY